MQVILPFLDLADLLKLRLVNATFNKEVIRYLDIIYLSKFQSKIDILEMKTLEFSQYKLSYEEEQYRRKLIAKARNFIAYLNIYQLDELQKLENPNNMILEVVF
jgi:hypothetical protein